MSPEVLVVSVDDVEHTTVISVIALQWLIKKKLKPPYTMKQISQADQYAAEEMEKMVNTYGPLKTDPSDEP